MGLIVRVPRRLRRSRRFRFDDDVELVVVGRDPDRCQIMFPPRMRNVGLEHVALRRVLGHYRLVVNEEDPVFVNGREAVDGEELPERCVLHLGMRGPRLVVECTTRRDLPPAERGARLHGHRVGPRAVLSSMRTNRRLALGAAALVVVAAGLLVWATWRPANEQPEGESALWAALERAVPSVYRVILRTADGGEYGSGTAWVVDGHRLATNAHVARIPEGAPPGLRMQVRSSGSDPRTYDVVGVTLHPGFEAFEALWRGYEPAEGARSGHLQPIQSAGGSADVALLEVGEGAALGPPLALADTARLYALAPGDAVGYVGYPSEALALHGSPVQHPTPHRQTGRITLVTNFFGTTGPPASNQLLQHTCPGTGGVSGSPLLDASGRVVGLVSAGNFAQGWGGRIPSGAGINYAQRADLLRELLEGRADALMPERLREWEARLEEAYPSAWRLQRAARIQGLLRELSDEHQRGSGGDEYVEWTRVWTLFADVDVEAPAEGDRPRMEVLQRGRHVLVASPLLSETVEISARFVGEDGAVAEHAGNHGLVDFVAPGPGTLTATLTAAERPVRTELLLYRGVPRHLTPAVVRRRVLGDWLETLRTWRWGAAVEPALLLEEAPQFRFEHGAGPGWVRSLDLPGRGDLLCLAVAREDVRIDLDVDVAATWEPYGRTDACPGSTRCAVVGGHVESTAELTVRVNSEVGPTGRTTVEVYVWFVPAPE